MSLLDYAEREGQKNMEFHIKSLEILSASCEKTLTFMLAAGSLSLTAGITSLMQPVTPATDIRIWGHFLIYLTIWLAGLSIWFMKGTMMAEDVHPPSNEPMNLYQPAHSLADIQAKELESLQRRINKVVEACQKKANLLNKGREALAATLIGTSVLALFVLIL